FTDNHRSGGEISADAELSPAPGPAMRDLKEEMRGTCMLKKEEALNGVKLFVLDMDGTVYLGDQMIDGSLDFIHDVEASEDRDYIFFTNNASRVPSVYVEKLHKLGLDVDESKVVTAGDVC